MTTLLTLEEVAEQLRKSDAQLRWMIHAGTAPKSAKIGGRRMFRAEDVETYIATRFDNPEVA
jgi:excisionase family DNA binding protein